MALILNLETATKSCSVSLGKDGALLAFRELNEDKFSHAEKLHQFISEVIGEAGIKISDLDAVAVGKGPGSYTGLRIGVSSAKGLTYGLDIPLISISSLETMAAHQIDLHLDYDFYCPMLDARRMEVYTTIFDLNFNQLEPVQAVILEENFSEKYLSKGKVLFFGDGSDKLKEVVKNENATYSDVKYPSSKDMIVTAERKFNLDDFEDKAYFEPFYLKDFIAGKPKKLK